MMSEVEPSQRGRKMGHEVTDLSEGQISALGLAEVFDSGSFETVRDLFFGPQGRELDVRGNLLEQRMLKESVELGDELHRSLEDLTGQFEKECHQFSQQLEKEQDQRSDTCSDLKKFLQGLEANIEKSLTRVDKQTNKQFETLQHHLMEQREELHEQGQRAMAKLEKQFQLAIHGLKNEKTDQGALAEMLMDVGVKLQVGSRDPECG